jgi:hypothetical protein
MPQVVISRDEWVSLSYRAPRRTRLVTVRVSATGPIDVWALPGEEEAPFSADTDFSYYAGREAVTFATFRFVPDLGADWTLIFESRHRVGVSVEYEVLW